MENLSVKVELRDYQFEGYEASKKANEGIFLMPTGSGKTRLEAAIIAYNIENGWEWIKSVNSDEVPVFVILDPRIILVAQIYKEMLKFLNGNGKDFHPLIVNSGRNVESDSEEIRKIRNFYNIPYREMKSTTSSRTITEEYEKAKAEKIPLVIFGTYDSYKKIIMTNLNIYMLICDEAHHLVSERFNKIADEEGEFSFPAFRKYYFTATLKETVSDNSLGMNNYRKFGHIIFHKSVAEMVSKGVIVRPRMHCVTPMNENEEVTRENEADYDVNCVIQSFIEHKYKCNRGAKMLVVTKGSEHLNDLVSHQRMINFLRKRILKIFDITSKYGPRINEKSVSREEFLYEINHLRDDEDAIILHIDILTEGIDVDGITGVLFLDATGISRFLQLAGRAMRTHKEDREKLDKKELNPNDLDSFIKPYAWIIIPNYGILGDEGKEKMKNIVYAMREMGFKASENVFIKQNRGSRDEKIEEGLNELDRRHRALFDVFIEMEHEIESKEEADILMLEEEQHTDYLMGLTFEESLKLF